MTLLARALIAIVTIVMMSGSTFADTLVRYVAPADTRVGIDLRDLASGSIGPVFVDALKETPPWSSTGRLTLDGDGNVRALESGQTAERTLEAVSAYPSGDYTLLYAGKGRIDVDGAAIVQRMPGRAIVRVAGRFSGLRLRLVATDPRDYVRDVRLILPGYEATAVRSPFLPSVVAALGRAKVLRFARWFGAQSSTELDWSARTTPAQSQIGSSGVALEYMIALANATGSDPWFVLPARVTDRYAYDFARLVRATLDARLRPIFESASTGDRGGAIVDAIRSRHVLDLISLGFGSSAARITRVLALPGDARITPDPRMRRLLEESLSVARADALAIDLGGHATQSVSDVAATQSIVDAAVTARTSHVALFAFDVPGGSAATRVLQRWRAAGGGLAVVSDAEPGYPQAPNSGARAPRTRLAVRANDASATFSIDAGGPAAAPYLADQDYGSGSFTSTTKNAIDTSGVSDPAPQAVYQSIRAGGTFSYTIPGLTPNANYVVRLHFSENYWNQSGKRIFNVSINGAQMLANFDIFAAAGKKFAAVARTLNVVTDANGRLVITFVRLADNASVAGIELAPSTAPKTTLNDWTTYGFDNARDGFNPNSTALTPASVAQLSEVWQANLLTNTQSQPIVATNVGGHAALLIVGGANGSAYALDAQSGTQVWKQSLGMQTYDCGTGPSSFGVGGTAVYDATSHSVFVPDDRTTGGVVADEIYRLDVATGTILGSANVAPSPLAMGSAPEVDFLHTALTLAPSGLLYAGTGSTCDVSPWRGRVAAVDTRSMTLAGTFFTAFGQGANFSGGGVWGWGGVSIDGSGSVYTGVGNADVNRDTSPYVTAPNEYAGYAEHVVKLSSDLSTVLAANYPGFTFGGNSVDLDFSGTPVLFSPLGCGVMSASQGKGGALVAYDTSTLSNGPIARFQLSESMDGSAYIGNPAYSPVTGLLYAAAASAQGGALEPPGLVAIAPSGCRSLNIVWHAQFGPDSLTYAKPRSAPTVTAGGVVLLGTPCSLTSDGTGCLASPSGRTGGALWAIDASSGALLGGGKPILLMPSPIRMAPVVDGNWVFVLDAGGHLAGLTLPST